jgi:hypothetical protein
VTRFAEESDADTTKGGRGGISSGVLGLRMQLERMDVTAQPNYFAHMQQQQQELKAAPVQPRPPLNRSVSASAALSLPSLSFPALNPQQQQQQQQHALNPQQQQQQQQQSSTPALQSARLPGTQFVV